MLSPTSGQLTTHKREQDESQTELQDHSCVSGDGVARTAMTAPVTFQFPGVAHRAHSCGHESPADPYAQSSAHMPRDFTH